MVKHGQKERQSAHRTQWVAQFVVASELCKRGYQVALTMGIHPVIDLMVVSPKGVPFLIDVKGQYIARREARGLDGEPLSFPSVEWDFATKHEGAWKALPE